VAIGTLASAAFILQLHERMGLWVEPSSDSLGQSLDEERLPKRIRRAGP
jgi:hypothetical protein